MSEITEQERKEFFNRQGWKNATPEERKAIEETWDEASIEMAIALNF